MPEDYLTFIILGTVLIIAGIAILISAASSGRKGHKECTERVMAHCVRIADLTNMDEKFGAIDQNQKLAFGMKAPIFEILYNGQAIELRPHRYSNVCNIQVGEAREILIDPRNPQKYYDPKQKKAKFTLANVIPALGLIGFGIMLLCIPAFGI